MSLERAVLIARRRVRSRLVADGWAEEVRTLLEAPSPAVLTTHRADGSVLVSPVWYRWADGAFEIVVAEGDSGSRASAARSLGSCFA